MLTRPLARLRSRARRTSLAARGGPRLGALLALASLLLLAAPAGAHAPDHRWRTLETPHFVLHFHLDLYLLAQRAANALERAHERLVPLFETEPSRKTQVVLSDDTDDANGSAMAYERPRIWLQAAPPDDLSVLGDYDDYVFLLVAHEYVHVLQLGTVSGIPAFLNRIFGERWTPNGVLPRFFIEGLATYHETQLSAGGRNRSALFDMYLRADALEDRLMPISQLTSGGLRWPWGTGAYLYGGRFLAYLAETRGDEAVRSFIHSYGDDLIPYSINRNLESAAGVSVVDLWSEWQGSLRQRYAEQEALVRARGPITEPARRSRLGHGTGAPRWSRDARSLYYVEATADRRPRLRVMDRESGADRVVHRMEVPGTLSPLVGAEGVIAARPAFFGAHRVHGELFRIDEGGEHRLSRGLRGSEPDLSPDGSQVYFVERRAGRTRLLRLPLAAPTAEPELVYEPPEGIEIFTPRVSPDGAWVAFSQTRRGPGRDVVVLPLPAPPAPGAGAAGDPLQGAPARLLAEPTTPSSSPRTQEPPLAWAITDDDALDLDPTWTPDGSALIFASDRSGIFNLYAAPLGGDGSDLLRLTNVLTGAFQPDLSADGAWLAWTTYGADGYDVAAIPVSSLAPVPAEPFVSDRAELSVPLQEERIYPIRPYRPLETLAPQSWLPYLGFDRDGVIVGATFAGSDAASRHAWALSAGHGIDSGEPEAAFAYSYGGWYLQPSVGAATAYRPVPGFPRGTTERISVGSLHLSLPIQSMRRSQVLRLGYEATYFAPLEWLDERWRPRPGLGTELQLQWLYTSTERPLESVVPENGIAAGILGRLGSRALGGDYEYRGLDATASAFLRLPWHRHHVLALGGSAGIGEGDLGDRHLYGLGGLGSQDLLVAAFTGRFLDTGGLRGYAPGAFVGSRFLLGTAAYHFPIAWIDRSPGTLPLYAGKLAGNVFAEAGNAFDGDRIPRLHPSIGGELRMGFDVGWGFAGSLRLGYAYGLDAADDGGSWPYLGIGAVF